MIVRFSIENYKSIQNRLDLSFIAEPLKQHEESNLIGTDFPKTSLLKSLAIYGANASGKSNLIKALDFVKEFVLSASIQSQTMKRINIEPYKFNIRSMDEPTWFELDFIAFENRYRYGFTATAKRIHSEYLFQVLKTTEKQLFYRNLDEIELSNSFSEGFGKESFIKPTTLFLSTLAQLNGTISSGIVEWLSNLTIITDQNYPSFVGYTANLIKEHQRSEFILEVFRAVGLNFDGVKIRTFNMDDNVMQFLSPDIREIVRKNSPHQLQVFTTHKVFDLNGNPVNEIEFDLREESAGSQKFFAIAGPIINSLLNGYPIVIDEMDARLHFRLVYFLVKLFNDEKHNPFGGQLVFSNHMIDLMERELLRRDQILLVSNSKSGTQLTSIHKQGARSDTSFKKDYLNGEFGALPGIEFNQMNLFDRYF